MASNSEHIVKRYDNIYKSPEDKREYRGLELKNRMKVLLISDPVTDKSAAALDVNIGKFSLYICLMSIHSRVTFGGYDL